MQTPHDYNPYQSPVSDTSYEEEWDEYGLLEEPNRLTASSGLEWITQAWPIFVARPFFWIGIFILYLLIMFVFGALSATPVLGVLINILLGIIAPMLMAGLYYIAHNIEYEQETGFGDLFVAFQGKFLDFLVLWLIQFVFVMALGFIAMLMVMALAFGFGMGPTPGQLGSADNLFIVLMVLIVLALVLPLVMMVYFAPILIVFHDLKAWEAMKLSFKACLSNILPFLLFGVIAFIMLIVGSIPAGLGLLVVLPILSISVYISYKQILTNSY